MSEVMAQIADELYEARVTRIPIDFVRHRLPDGDKEAAYRISELVTRRRERDEGRRRVGRKVA